MDLFYIYKITNNLDGKTYIGQKKYRIGDYHKYAAGKYTDDYESLLTDGYYGGGKLIKAAIKEFGKENFTKEILVSHLEFQEAADEAEKVFIKCYRELGKAEYNIADGGIKGFHLTEKAKQHLSECNKGEKHRNYGKHLPQVIRSKISEAHKGLVFSEEHRQHLSEAHKGKKQTEEIKKKRAAAMIGKNKGRHWFNNGERQVFQFECPDGFTPGQLRGNK